MNKFEFTIPAHNVAALEHRVAVLNKKADKLDVPRIIVEVGETFVKDEKKFTKIAVIGEAPVINGWRLAAAIEYIETGTIVKSAVNGFECPKHYINAKPFCEHCETHKVKKFTFLLENVESGDFLNVGRTCLKDFMCRPVDQELARFQWFSEIIEELSDPESGYYGYGGGELYFDVETVLAYAHVDIKEWGYRKTSDESGSTVSAVMSLMFDKNAPRITLTDENRQFAKDVIEYVESSDANNDFMINVKNLVAAGDITTRMFGLLIGAAAGYLYKKSKEVTDAPELDEYFGEIKKRYTLELTLTFSTSVEGFYGTTYIHGFKDSEGRSLTWFGTKKLRHNPTEGNFTGEPVEVGETVKVKATVKKHELYKDRKQTQLNRVAIA